ncbi:MAG: hypothetical protein GTN49_11970 [candidate division Zixibacteria bacterium]|nr:hypothetical protein [candidate division Zixibacteria bacterium]
MAMPAWSDGAGVVAAEVGCGYVGGIAAGLAGVPVGNIFSTDEFAGGGFYGFFIGYPAGVGLGVYGAGEIWGDDSRNDWASVGAAIGASYAPVAAGYLLCGYKGLLIGMLLAPAASTAAYNLVKNSEERNSSGDGPAPKAFYVQTTFCF